MIQQNTRNPSLDFQGAQVPQNLSIPTQNIQAYQNPFAIPRNTQDQSSLNQYMLGLNSLTQSAPVFQPAVAASSNVTPEDWEWRFDPVTKRFSAPTAPLPGTKSDAGPSIPSILSPSNDGGDGDGGGGDDGDDDDGDDGDGDGDDGEKAGGPIKLKKYADGGNIDKQSNSVYQSPFQIQQNRPDSAALDQYMYGLNKSLQGSPVQYSAPSLEKTGTTASDPSVLSTLHEIMSGESPNVPTYSYTPPKPVASTTYPTTADVMPRSTDSDAPGTPVGVVDTLADDPFLAHYYNTVGGPAGMFTPNDPNYKPPDSTPMGGGLAGMVQPPPPPPPPAPEVPTYGGSPIFTNDGGDSGDGGDDGDDDDGDDGDGDGDGDGDDGNAGGPVTKKKIKTKRYAMGGIATLPTYAAGGKLLNGAGDGMSDSIPAVINGPKPQRAALADGEFVIPADVVSHLGNGSTKAGAKRLYQMMDKVRMARVGTKKQGKQINPSKFMPALK
jgi:hypothetical protein